MHRFDRSRLASALALALGVGGCGGASAESAQPDPSQNAQVIDGEARCGVGSNEEVAPAIDDGTDAATSR